jgi:hypothetical protein
MHMILGWYNINFSGPDKIIFWRTLAISKIKHLIYAV